MELKFKNNISVFAESKSLLKAFEEEAVQEGWGFNKGSNLPFNECNSLLFFGTLNRDLKPGQYWYASGRGTDSLITNYDLPRDWDIAISAMKERFSPDIEKVEIGDYVIMKEAGGWGYHPDNNGCMALVTAVDYDSNYKDLPYIKGYIINPNYDNRIHFKNIPFYNTNRSKWWEHPIIRKATVKDIKDNLPKAGDYVTRISHFDNKSTSALTDLERIKEGRGGLGLPQTGEITCIRKIYTSAKGNIAFCGDKGTGAWIVALRKVTDTEMKGSVEIDSYKSDFSTQGVVKFGCKTFTKEQVDALYGLLTMKDDEYLPKFTVNGIEITVDILDKIIKGINK